MKKDLLNHNRLSGLSLVKERDLIEIRKIEHGTESSERDKGQKVGQSGFNV